MLGEYNKSASSPFLKLNETMQNTAYTTHTYKHTTIGFLADIKDMPNQYAYSKVFFDRWYRPENCTIIVAGDVKHDELWSRSSSSTTAAGSEARRRSRFPSSRPRPSRDSAADLAAADPAHSCTSVITFRRPTPRIPTRPRCGALEQAVFGETSPLYQELVLEGTKGRHDAWPRPSRSATRAFSRSWCGCGSRRIWPSCAHGSPRPWPRRPRPRSTRLDWTRSSRICATSSPAR